MIDHVLVVKASDALACSKTITFDLTGNFSIPNIYIYIPCSTGIFESIVCILFLILIPYYIQNRLFLIVYQCSIPCAPDKTG